MVLPLPVEIIGLMILDVSGSWQLRIAAAAAGRTSPDVLYLAGQGSSMRHEIHHKQAPGQHVLPLAW